MSHSKKILYIDDDAINIELFKINFSRKFDVYTGLSADEGIKILNENPDIDIVITDMKMPGKSGLQFIHEIFNNFTNKRCYMLSGYGINDEISKAMKEGLVIQCFSKPMNRASIEEIINLV
jgi:two-component system response regulator (stage 0 sporulation protein F)